jgi:hypothetical protein
VSLRTPILKLVFPLFLVTLTGNVRADNIAVENPAKNDLRFRGQGPNPWCYAFAEEQLIKDALCSGAECDGNAATLKYSIIDIADATAKRDDEKDPSAAASSFLPVDQKLFKGSGDFFSIGRFPNPAITRSECTLEPELFLWNRSLDFNPKKLDISQQINEFYSHRRTYGAWGDRGAVTINWMQSLDSDKRLKPSQIAAFKAAYQIDANRFADEKSKLEAAGLAPLMDQLDKIAEEEDAHAQNGETSFADSVLKFRRCENRADLSKLIPRQTLLLKPEEIQEKIEQLTSQNKSLEVGICAEVVEHEEMGSLDYCGGHAIVVKKIRRINTGIDLMVVDSAFFSPRPRNGDGSIWVPEAIVVMAAQKYAQHLAKTIADLESEQRKIISKNSSESALSQSKLETALDRSIAEVRKFLIKRFVTKSDNTNYIVSMLQSSQDPIQYADLIKKIQTSRVRSKTDLEAFLLDLRNVQLSAIQSQLSHNLDGIKNDFDLNASNIDWFDTK